jgi:rubrerythrin
MYNLLADVKFSIKLEEKGLAFYLKTAAKTNNPLAAATLTSLADREKTHITRITEFYKSLTDKKQLESGWLKGVAIPPTKQELLKPILKKLQDNLNRKFETPEDLTAAYKVAEGLETDSFNLYEKISRETDNEIAKKFYSSLAQEEREHYTILDETLQYLDHPGDWFREQERWIVEG